MAETKITVFIGSSTEGLPYAEAVQQNLAAKNIPSYLWNQGIVLPGDYLPDTFLSDMDNYGFAIFVFSPDDIITVRGKETFTTRDNVVFELGLFMGAIGRQRCFILMAKGKDPIHLPTDLAGITYVPFTPPSDDNLQAATGAAVNTICKKMTRLKPREIPDKVVPVTEEFIDSLVAGALQTVCLAASIPVTPEIAKLRAFIFKKVGENLVCKHYWTPNRTREEKNKTKFDLTDPLNGKLAVVQAYANNDTQRQAVDPKEQMKLSKDVIVSQNITYVLASPIWMDKDREKVWGVVDFDAGNDKGAEILKTDEAASTLYQLAEHLTFIFSGL